MKMTSKPYTLMSNPESNTHLDFREIFNYGKELFGLSLGIIGSCEDEQYKLESISTESEEFKAGKLFPLKNTYCKEVIDSKQVIALTHYNGVLGLREHPVYQDTPLEAYIGAPIYNRGRIWGTISFSSINTKPSMFTTEDIEQMKSLALLTEAFLKEGQRLN